MMEYRLDEPAPPPSVRTCNGCLEVFRVRQHRRHVQNDCGKMISTDQLEAAIQEIANRGGDSITFVELAATIERVAVTRMSAIYRDYPEGKDKIVAEDGNRRTILCCASMAQHRVYRRRKQRSERGVGSITEDLNDLHI